MANFLLSASYTQQGIQGVLKEGASGRADAIGKLVDSVGGTVVGLWWAFGDDDIFIVTDLPDNQAAMALAATVGASGAARVSTTVLLTAAEVDEAIHRTVTYRAPGT
jgi:uncharacterized protein with GYD domain